MENRDKFDSAYMERKKSDQDQCGEQLTAPAAPRDFSWALTHLKNDKPLARHGWNGKGMAIALQRPDIHSKMTLPYIFMVTAQGQKVPWIASQTDLLAEDWFITF